MRVIAVAAVLAATSSVAGCGGSTVTGQGSVGSRSAVSSSVPSDFPSTPSSAVTPSAPPSTPSATFVPTPSGTSAPPTNNATRDITDVRFTKPPGFAYSTAYHPVHPPEQVRTSKYLVPAGTQGLDVIAVTLYRLPRPGLVTTPAQQLARVQLYNRRAGAQIQHGINRTTVGGYPALQEDAFEEGEGQTFHYAAWYVFGSAHVLLVSCQVQNHIQKIVNGCVQLLGSMQVS